MVPYGGPGFVVLPNGGGLHPAAPPPYMYGYPMPVPGAHQPGVVLAGGPGARWGAAVALLSMQGDREAAVGSPCIVAAAAMHRQAHGCACGWAEPCGLWLSSDVHGGTYPADPERPVWQP